MSSAAAAHRKVAELGKWMVRMTTQAGSGHPSSALSIAHIVVELMYRHMRYDPANPWHASADRLVLSEGHAVPAVYAAYADLNGTVGEHPSGSRGSATLRMSDLDSLRARESVLDGHPNPAEGFPFFDAATGSLGMGLSVAAGLALAARLDKSPRRVFVIIGDGESREGQIWEAADFIADHKLSRICAFFNCNHHGQAAVVSPQQSPDRLAAKLSAFGWQVERIKGHDPQEIDAALARFDSATQPLAIVAETVKGWGVDALLDGNWHGKPLKDADLQAADASLDRIAMRLAGGAAAELARPPTPQGQAEIKRPDPRAAEWPAFDAALQAAGLEAALGKRQLATRRAFGVALKVAGDLIPQVAALDADVSNSTFTEIFAKAHPDRFFECKIAEQNMVSTAAGLSAAGYIPVVASFAKFIARAYDQVELANISRANIKLVGSHAGISLAADGPSQMALLDVAFFRAFTTVRGDDRRNPLCWVYQPADAISAYHCTRLMIETPGMCYMRTFRPDVQFLYEAGATFAPGGFNLLRPGDQLALVAAGYMTHVALQAAELLARQGVRAAVIDAYCLPFDADRMHDELLRRGGLALVAEDNYGGGLGSAVAELAARSGKVRCETLLVQRVPKSARTEQEILDYCGVGAKQVADHAKALLARR